ncbi:MAG: DUF2062 domain-containing protein [Planctomycetota bacterium]|jgi:uncharacterized protein (DUF2062 family)
MKHWLYEKIVVQLLEIHDTPSRIARGIGIGTLIAFTPFMGFQMLITATINTFLHANRLAGILMAWITNPVTMFIIYPVNYFLGAWILNIFTDWKYLKWGDITALIKFDTSLGWWDKSVRFVANCLDMGIDVFVAMLLGGFIIGGIFGVILFRITYRAIVRSRKRKSKLYYMAIEGAISKPANGCVCAAISGVAKEFLVKHYTWDDIRYTVFIFRDRCIECGRGYKRYLIDLFAYLDSKVAHLGPELKRRTIKEKFPENRELAATLVKYIGEVKARKKAGVWTEKPEEAPPAESEVPELPERAPENEKPLTDSADTENSEKTDHGVEV